VLGIPTSGIFPDKDKKLQNITVFAIIR